MISPEMKSASVTTKLEMSHHESDTERRNGGLVRQNNPSSGFTTVSKVVASTWLGWPCHLALQKLMGRKRTHCHVINLAFDENNNELDFVFV